MNEMVLGRAQLEQLIRDGALTVPAAALSDGQLQPASLDLRLGAEGYRLIGSFIPDKSRVADRAHELAAYEVDLAAPAVLETGQVYLFRLREEVYLPPDVRGRCNPKSSIGRVDVFTRVVCDAHDRFDEIPAGYRGPLWVEVYPRSFPVRVAQGLALTQLRLFRDASAGPPVRSVEVHRDGAEPVRVNGDEVVMSLSLIGGGGAPAGYRARRHTPVLDLLRERSAHPRDYWEVVQPSRAGHYVLEPEAFYLFKSVERVRIPPETAGEMIPVDPSYGELRTHYAGFFDPGFGWDCPSGVPAVLEVRAHDVPFAVAHGQPFFRLRLERVLGAPRAHYGAALGSHYHGQDLTHAKFFCDDWEE